MSDFERFLKEYCGKCGKACKAVDERSLRRRDDGEIMCTRYVCAVLTDDWRR